MLLRNSGDMKQVQWNIVENHDEDQGKIVYNKIRPNVHNSQGTGCHKESLCLRAWVQICKCVSAMCTNRRTQYNMK